MGMSINTFCLPPRPLGTPPSGRRGIVPHGTLLLPEGGVPEGGGGR